MRLVKLLPTKPMYTSTLARVLSLVAIATAVISCSPDSSKPVPPPVPVLINGFPLDSAIVATARFRKFSQLILGGTPIKAFTVRGADLMEALDLDSLLPTNEKQRNAFIDTTAIRVYMGIDSIPDTSDKKFHYEFKLFVANVNKSSYSKNEPGQDVFFSSTKVSLPKSSANDSYVLDFNQPCPNTCDTSSPLN